MKEIREIIISFEEAVKEHKKTALATVVYVDGSSYRRPGARMLITEDGVLTGAISGGCLEGDALKKAQLVIFQQKPMMVTYDTRDDDDAKFGVGLGCNGLIHVLIEPIDDQKKNHPIQLLKYSLQNRENKILVTFFNILNKKGNQLGTKMLLEGSDTLGEWDDIQKTLKEQAIMDAQKVMENQKSMIIAYPEIENTSVFLEILRAPISLIVVGAGNDAIPLVKFADVLGWEITIVDGRASYASKIRFPLAGQFVVKKAGEILPALRLDSRSVIVLMTHNFDYELEFLASLIPIPIPYVGMLGPKKKLDKLIENIEKKGIHFTKSDRSKIFGPIGLNIGAEAPEEIALSMVSEIQAVIAGEQGGFLRDKRGPIHDAQTGNPEENTHIGHAP